MTKMTIRPDEPVFDAYPFEQRRPATAVEIMDLCGPEGNTGQFLLAEFSKFIADKTPMDDYGFPWPMKPDQLPNWREYSVRELHHALRIVAKCSKMMKEAR